MKIKSTDYNGIYSEIFEVFGEEITEQFHHHFKGHQICCPMKLYSKEYIKKYVKEYYDGNNARQVAKHLGYSERWIKQIITREGKSNENNIKCS